MGGKVPVSEGLEHTDLPDGTGEFLDAWLMLVEKMVNPSTVLDSPHSLPAKMPGVTPTMPQFSALRFLIVTQKVSIQLFPWVCCCLQIKLVSLFFHHGKSIIHNAWFSSGWTSISSATFWNTIIYEYKYHSTSIFIWTHCKHDHVEIHHTESLICILV